MLSLLRGGAPDDPLLIDLPAEGDAVVTRAALLGRVAARAAEFAARGIGPGDAVAVMLPNWSEAIVWQFAAVARGAHLVGINTRYGVAEIGHVLALARPRLVAVAEGFRGLDLEARLRAAAGAEMPAVIRVSGPAPAGAADAAMLRDDPDALAVAFTTSGSTGMPKLAAHRVGAVAAHARAVAAAGGWDARSVTLCALPLSGTFAFVPAMASLAAGGRCLLLPSFEPEVALAAMRRHGVTHLAAGDDIVARLAERATPKDLRHWKRLFLADFAGRAEELAHWAEAACDVRVTAAYGSSEIFALAAFRRVEDAALLRWKAGGVPLGLGVRAADPENGRVLPPGVAGELQFQGANVVDAYLGDPARRAAQMTEDGWFRSGDLGLVRADGGFDFLCRIGDALRLKGFLVEPAEIENRLAAHGAVDQAKVVGIRSASGETVAVGFVTLKGEASAEALLAWCGAALARFKVPAMLHVLARMPVTVGVNGTKIKAATLRDWAAARAADAGFRFPED